MLCVEFETMQNHSYPVHNDRLVKKEKTTAALHPHDETTDPEPLSVDESFGLTAGVSIYSEIALGSRLGNVRLDRIIADGGMGRVYEGTQESPARKVAVKVLRPDRSTPELIRRFSLEVDVLGKLRHPFIAQIYTASTYHFENCDIPYFVMEYIEHSQSITDYVIRKNLNQQDCLILFRDVCRAIGQGHANGIIHRDIKPNNVLVDNAGQPKVIDFGIARVIDTDVPDATAATTMGNILGTTAYMSPEQLDGDCGKVDARTDVYALGTLLYKMLTGHHPLLSSGIPVHEIARVIHEDFPKPLKMYRPDIKKDTCAVVDKCLLKEKWGRYSNAMELGDDIERLLDGVPVLAKPVSLPEKAVRFVRRHRVVSAAAATAIIATIIGITGVTSFALKASQQATIAQEKKQQADTTLALLIDAFRSPEPLRNGYEITVVEMLSQAAEKIRNQDSGSPQSKETQAVLLEAIGLALRNSGALVEGLEILKEAKQRSEGTDANRSISSALASCYATLGNYGASEDLYQILWKNSEHHENTVGAKNAVESVNILLGLTEAQLRLGKYTDAEKHVDEAMSIIEQNRIDDQRLYVRILNAKGRLKYSQGQSDAALRLHTKAVALSETYFGQDDPFTIRSLSSLAQSAIKNRDLDHAQNIYRRTLPIASRIFGENNYKTLLMCTSYGQLLLQLGRYEEALLLLNRARSGNVETLGDTHPNIAVINGSLARILVEHEKDYTSAEKLILQSLSIQENLFGRNHLQVAETLATLAWCYNVQGKMEEAHDASIESLKIRRTLLGSEHPDVAHSLVKVIPSELALGNIKYAEQCVNEAIAIFEKNYGDMSFPLTSALGALCRVRTAQGRNNDAVTLATRSVKIHEQLFGSSNPKTFSSIQQLVRLLHANGKTQEANAYEARLGNDKK